MNIPFIKIHPGMGKLLLAGFATATLTGCEAVSSPEAATPQAAPQAAAMAPAKNIDAASGISRDALVSIMGIENKVVVFFIAARASQAQLAAAPAKLCAARGLRLASSEIKDLDHPASMPGVRKLVATCR